MERAIEKRRFHSVWDRLLSSDAANRMIATLLVQNTPCLVGRIGHTEGRIAGEYLFRRSLFSLVTHKQTHQNAGIFPVTSQVLSAFAGIYLDSIGQVDLLDFWQTSYQAQLLAERFSGIVLAPLQALEPYTHSCPWSAALEQRRVLVVHPFAASILQQYQFSRGRIFGDHDVLPEFDLQVLPSPQTLAPLTGGYGTWIDALHDLTDRVLQLEFDVALIGCGAYGLPLGAAIKDAGRQAIHLGGALQILFGIRGRRWEQIPAVAALMNDHWIRPSSEETPASASLVDEGCYW